MREFDPRPEFDGDTYEAPLDKDRLHGQLERVRVLMSDRKWRTLAEIHEEVGGPEASVSARLRDLRKPKFGGLRVERERIPEGNGLFRYRVLPPLPQGPPIQESFFEPVPNNYPPGG